MALEKPSDNPPQICRIQYALLSSIESILTIKSFAAIIALKESEDWENFYGTPSAFVFTETEERTDAGIIFKQQLQLQYPGTDPLAQDIIVALDNRPLILLIHYQDEKIRVMGSIQEPALLSGNFESGNRTGFNIQFSNTSTERSRFLYPDLPSVP